MKDFFVKAFTILLLLGFIAFGIYLAFFVDGVWVTESGREVTNVGSLGIRVVILLFFGVFPLFLILWILFPKPFNKLLYKAVNKFMRSGARVLKYKEQREEQNVPDVTINGINLPTVMAAADMLGDSINREEPPELAEELDALPYVCEECGFVLEATAKFCSNCGAERKS